MFSSEKLVVEPQTEACSAQSIGPDFGVLTVNADLAGMPLISELGGNTRMRPSKRVVTITNHLERIVPLRLTGNIPVETY